MKLLAVLVPMLAVLPGVMAAAEKKQVIVWFEGGAPKDIVEKTKKACQEAGGRVIHMYELLSGFLANADEDVIDAIRLFATTDQFSGYKLHIEENKEAHTYGSS